MSAASKTGSVRLGGRVDPYVVELSKLMLARAPGWEKRWRI